MAEEMSNEEALGWLSLGVQQCAKKGEKSSYEYGHSLINDRLDKWERENPRPDGWKKRDKK